MKIEGKTFWCAINVASADDIQPNGAKFRLPRGNGCRFPIAIFEGDTANADFLVNDFTNVVSATMELRKTNASGERLIEPIVIPVEDFDVGLTFAEWAARSSQHFAFTLLADQTGWALGGGWDGELYAAFGLDTSDYGPITLGFAYGTLFEDGIGGTGAVTPSEVTYYSGAESDARYERKSQVQTAEIGDGEDYVDFTVDASHTVVMLLGVKAPGTDGTSDTIAMLGYHKPDSTTVRARLNASAPSVGYVATISTR